MNHRRTEPISRLAQRKESSTSYAWSFKGEVLSEIVTSTESKFKKKKRRAGEGLQSENGADE